MTTRAPAAALLGQFHLQYTPMGGMDRSYLPACPTMELSAWSRPQRAPLAAPPSDRDTVARPDLLRLVKTVAPSPVANPCDRRTVWRCAPAAPHRAAVGTQTCDTVGPRGRSTRRALCAQGRPITKAKHMPFILVPKSPMGNAAWGGAPSTKDLSHAVRKCAT
jgi:hypothetical protein